MIQLRDANQQNANFAINVSIQILVSSFSVGGEDILFFVYLGFYCTVVIFCVLVFGTSQ